MCSPASMPIPFDAARRIAAEHDWREKVLVYLTRGNAELLVLEHSDQFPSAGVQVPGGGVEPNEHPQDAARRELFEETGVSAAGPTIHVESHVWTTKAPSRVRHYYWVKAPQETPDAWWHEVSAGDADAGMAFRLSFRSLHAPGLTPGFGWESALARLLRLLR